MRTFVLAAAVVFLLTGASGPVVNVMYAGSLVTPMERSVGPAFAQSCACEYRGEAKGSVAIARLIEAGVKTPDVFISADTHVLDGLMTGKTPFISWYATMGTAHMVLGYSPKSKFASRFALAAAHKLSIAGLLQTPGLRIGFTDPKLDPKGYRSLIVLRLLATHFKNPALVATPANIYPEESLLVRLESGDLDASLLYSTESVSRHIPAIALPEDTDLGHAALANVYRHASVHVGDTTYVGAPIVYAVTTLNASRNPSGAAQFVRFVTRREGRRLLIESGLTPVIPQVTGDRKASPI